MNEKELDLLNNWNWNVLESDENLITPYGNLTAKMLGLRTWIRLKQLIHETVLMDQVKIKSTVFKSAKQTAEKYLQGLFRFWPFKINIQSNPIEHDYLLKYTEICEKFLIVYLIFSHKLRRFFNYVNFFFRILIQTKMHVPNYLLSIFCQMNIEV